MVKKNYPTCAELVYTPILLPVGSVNMPHHPMPGISVFCVTVLAPSDSACASVVSMSSVEMYSSTSPGLTGHWPLSPTGLNPPPGCESGVNCQYSPVGPGMAAIFQPNNWL